MSTQKILIGVVAGVAAGAIVGLLYAPKKGAQMRKIINRKVDEYADTLKEKFDDLLEKFEEEAENAMEKGKSVFSESKVNGKNVKA